MAFTGYLIKKFDYTHENTFFRQFYSELKNRYQSSDENCILIGNIICNGHEMDAIFLKSGQITIIDFKDYEGKIEFSENNPWKIWKNNNFTFIAGGAKMRNPFQQIRAYRYSLYQFLEARKERILESERDNIRWDHVGGVVLFQQDIEFNHSDIPQRINRFFHVADVNDIYNFLEDKNSPSLTFSSNELESILKVLDVRPENVFDEAYEEEIPRRTSPTEKLQLAKKLLPDNLEDNIPKRALQYFSTLINLERYKEPTASDLHRYAINWAEISDVLSIDLSINPQFHTIFLNNLQQRFPKNLFIGINVFFGNETIPVLHTILLVSEVEDINNVSVKISDFSLFTDSLQQFGLSEDLMEELITSINNEDALADKIDSISEFTGINANLVNSISVGLSNENMFSIQLLSELRKLIKRQNFKFQNDLFISYLLNKKIDVKTEPVSFEPFVYLTKLNSSQLKAIKLSFTQPLTVITGPPGTGKSQVVLNLIANSIVNNKSVLFASKNNKAVDTVKERMDELLNEEYLLRFGSANEVKTGTKKLIEKFINRKNQNQFSDTDTELINISKKIQSINSKISVIIKKINKIPELKRTIKNLRKITTSLNSDYSLWKDSLISILRTFFVEEHHRFSINVLELTYLLKDIEFYQSNWFGRLLFQIFKKNKVKQKIEDIRLNIESNIFQYISLNAPAVSIEKSLVESYYEHVLFIVELIKECDEISKMNDIYNEKIKVTEKQLDDAEKELKRLENEKEILRSEYYELIEKREKISLNYTNSFIQKKLSILDTPNIQNYIDYLPNNIPWRSEEILLFEESCNQFLENFSAICVTNLSVKNGFPLTRELFDLVVIDEASQCDIASAIPLIFRAKKVVVIGDPLQLTHITSVREFEETFIEEQLNLIDKNYNYVEHSLFYYCNSLSNRSQFESVILNEHFRCHPEIIKFSNNYFYEPGLGQSLDIKTKRADFKFSPTGITWHHVNGQVSEGRNVNDAEVNRIIGLAIQLYKRYPEATIGIETPFKHQYETIFNRLPENIRDKIKVDVVHKYQGDEKDIILFSLVVSDGCRPWLSNFINFDPPRGSSYLLNVGVTRAKSSLHIIGNFDYCKNQGMLQGPTYLSRLANYVDSLNKVER